MKEGQQAMSPSPARKGPPSPWSNSIITKTVRYFSDSSDADEDVRNGRGGAVGGDSDDAIADTAPSRAGMPRQSSRDSIAFEVLRDEARSRRLMEIRDSTGTIIVAEERRLDARTDAGGKDAGGRDGGGARADSRASSSSASQSLLGWLAGSPRSRAAAAGAANVAATALAVDSCFSRGRHRMTSVSTLTRIALHIYLASFVVLRSRTDRGGHSKRSAFAVCATTVACIAALRPELAKWAIRAGLKRLGA